MFNSLEELERALKLDLAQKRFFSNQSWVYPRKTNHGKLEQDVIIVGAGQSGLSLFYNLKLRGVNRITIIDKQEKGKPGPWSSIARMKQLRTPKTLVGPESGNPLLSYLFWFCSKYSKAEYDTYDFIPLHYWVEYLDWFTHVLAVDIVSGVNVTSIDWCDSNSSIRVDTDSNEIQSLYTKKVCLATGITGAGAWLPPKSYIENIPRESYACSWEQINFKKLKGKRIAVIGSGASAFDNAIESIKGSCHSIVMYSRSKLPKKSTFFELWKGRDDSELYPELSSQSPADMLKTIVDHNHFLTDEKRIKLLKLLFKDGRSASTPDYLKGLEHKGKIFLLDGEPITAIHAQKSTGVIKVISKSGEREFDFVIFATGPVPGLQHKAELSNIKDKILTWQQDSNLNEQFHKVNSLPRLSSTYHFLAKESSYKYVEHIYSFADFVQKVSGIHGVAEASSQISQDISKKLFESEFNNIIDFAESVNPASVA